MRKWIKLTNGEIINLLEVRMVNFDEMSFGYNCTKLFFGDDQDWWKNTLDETKYKLIDGELYKKVST